MTTPRLFPAFAGGRAQERKAMSKTNPSPRLVTANRLSDGRVVFLAVDGRWTERIGAARLARDDDEAAALERQAAAAEKANLVVDPYLVEVEARNGAGLVPVELRERLRIAGPTVGHSRRRRPTLTSSIKSEMADGFHVQI